MGDTTWSASQVGVLAGVFLEKWQAERCRSVFGKIQEPNLRALRLLSAGPVRDGVSNEGIGLLSSNHLVCMAMSPEPYTWQHAMRLLDMRSRAGALRSSWS